MTRDAEEAAPAAWLAAQIEEASAAGIAATVSRLIRDGTLEAGTRLPTVRDLAPRLHVGPGTVSAAWRALREQRFVEGGGRGGMRVAGSVGGPSPLRYTNITRYWSPDTLNLSRAVPDPALLPDLAPALQHALTDPKLHSYEVDPITASLQAAAASTWPFPAEAWLCSRGGYDGLLGLISTSVVAGETVAIEEPATPRLLDILDHVGARVLPVALDDDGPVPERLAAALRHKPVAFIYEPRNSSWAGATVTPTRQAELAQLLEHENLLVIEDDAWGTLSAEPYHGVGALLPHKTVMVRSYSKSHSPDLRIGVVGGAASPIERVRVFRQFGDGWTSRILQDALAWLLTDPESQATVTRASEVYTERRQRFAALLRERGLEVHGGDNLALWVPVRNEHQAMLVMASHGIATIASSASWSGRGPEGVRVVTAHHVPELEKVADVIALAAQAH
ncbi:aminotransferase class I/II-fold pyridoxal phosphate-dependent enzyme [Ornithinimicrobium cavernae]|uniref:aminotransferase class I/II-fold pyridoxal phosphate-dependent enzyme n=1 Tax=Ornithinimicrobium cavernae TaxID=2666047 RepID=UPI000D69D8BF|nr:aminotransferase class I/II-fold pyridoxal phosphate-dependent enzyme [Ornithinimicrobium cavernae]